MGSGLLGGGGEGAHAGSDRRGQEHDRQRGLGEAGEGAPRHLVRDREGQEGLGRPRVAADSKGAGFRSRPSGHQDQDASHSCRAAF